MIMYLMLFFVFLQKDIYVWLVTNGAVLCDGVCAVSSV